MGGFIRRMIETHTEMTEFLLSAAKHGVNPRYPRKSDQSDGEVVMSDLAIAVSDLGTAANRVIGEWSLDEES